MKKRDLNIGLALSLMFVILFVILEPVVQFHAMGMAWKSEKINFSFPSTGFLVYPAEEGIWEAYLALEPGSGAVGSFELEEETGNLVSTGPTYGVSRWMVGHIYSDGIYVFTADNKNIITFRIDSLGLFFWPDEQVFVFAQELHMKEILIRTLISADAKLLLVETPQCDFVPNERYISDCTLVRDEAGRVYWIRKPLFNFH